MSKGRHPELSGRPRRRIQAQVRREEPNCWICGGLIDLSLPRGGPGHPKAHPMSSVIDEVVARSVHPLGARYAATYRPNVRHAHNECNAKRGNGTRTTAKRDDVIVRGRVW